VNPAGTRSVVGIVVACAVVAGGCSTGKTTDGGPVAPAATSAAVSDPAAAVDRLRAGTAFIDQVSFISRLVIAEGQLLSESRVDNLNKRSVTTMTTAEHVIETRMIGDGIYMLARTLPGASDGWMILDPAKIPAGFEMSFDRGKNDPGGSARLINAITSARVSGSEITGTVDVVKIGTGNGISFRANPGGEFPKDAVNQEFRATLDSQGRLAKFVIPGSQVVPQGSVSYSDFGVAVAVSPPRGAKPAPETIYPMLGLR